MNNLNKHLTLEDINNLDNTNLFYYSYLIELFGIKVEFELYEEVLKLNSTYEDYEDLSSLISFIMKKDVTPSDLMTTEDETINKLIDLYEKKKEMYDTIKKVFGVDKTEVDDLMNKIDEKLFLLKLPQYYLSYPLILRKIVSYNIFGNDNLMNEIGILKLTGGLDPIDKNSFNKIINMFDDIIK